MTTYVAKPTGKILFDSERFHSFLARIFDGLKLSEASKQKFIDKQTCNIIAHEEILAQDIEQNLILSSLELVSEIKEETGEVTEESLSNVNWTFFAARVLLHTLYKRAARNRSFSATEKYSNYPGLVEMLVHRGLYSPVLLQKYSFEELISVEGYLDPEKDLLFDYAGLRLLSERYLIRGPKKEILELPQERFLTAALWINQDEPSEIRLEKVKELYWALSNLVLSLATPSLANSGKPYNSLASCHQISLPDNLTGIYDGLANAAEFSKNGAGLGVGFSRLRSTGSSIKGFEDRANSFIYWLKLFDTTATAVDQQGTRNGSIAAWLTVWHADIFRFLDLRLNTGDQNQRAHNLSQGITVPDIFWRTVEARGDWYTFDPKDVEEHLGFSLNDCYDHKTLQLWETPNIIDHEFSVKYGMCVDSNIKSKKRFPVMELVKSILRSQVESGFPYIANIDTMNRKNANSHAGMIEFSNLCTEIAEVTSPNTYLFNKVNDKGEVESLKQSGYMVTCNLSSLVLDRICLLNPEEFEQNLEKVIKIQVRALDNVISVGRLPVPEAEWTNKQFRNIGAGELGFAALLALKGIHWDSPRAEIFTEDLESEILYQTISASSELAGERGSYPLYPGSDWETGVFFFKHNLEGPRWEELKTRVRTVGMRNGQLRAPAPNASSATLVGSTAATENISDIIIFQKKSDSIVPIPVPHLSPETWFFYRPIQRLKPYEGESDLKFLWAAKLNAIRQKFVDQAISFNTYITSDISGKNLLRIHLENWKSGVKTSYYTSSKDQETLESCIACSA